jgi:uncharacterized protein (DUF1330 family)
MILAKIRCAKNSSAANKYKPPTIIAIETTRMNGFRKSFHMPRYSMSRKLEMTTSLCLSLGVGHPKHSVGRWRLDRMRRSRELSRHSASTGVEAVLAEGGSGMKVLARGGRVVSIFGDPPKGRVVVNVFDSLDKAIAAYNSPDYKAAKVIGDKYATFRTYAVEALPQ